MIVAQSCYDEMINSVARTIKARVELLEGDSILDTFTYDGALQSYTVERIGEESKFFGFGVCQKLIVKLRDNERKINIVKGQKLDIAVGVGCEYIYTFPVFFVEEIKRDENTNELEITAYDAIYQANNYTVSDIPIQQSYTLLNLVNAAGSVLGMPVRIVGDIEAFNLMYEDGGNFGGEESLRSVLNSIAEATQTVYYQCSNWCLTFKRLDRDGEPVLHIDKSKYFTLTNKTPITLGNIMHVTELGDNVKTVSTDNGVTQFVRDNPFYNMRNDIDALLNDAIEAVGGTTINQFDLKWRGNFLVEPFDKISIETKDGEFITTFVVNDTIDYKGGLVGKTKWEYVSNDGETPSNPTTLGETLKQTTARVDKQNQRIDLVASDVSANNEAISSLQLTTNSINASVTSVEKNMNEKIDAVDEELTNVKNSVDAKMSATDVSLAIKSELSNGVSSVVTETGFKFDNEGLSITKSGSEMSTQITDDGMKVFRSNTAVLTANNVGVDAVNLHATTYLIIGNNSRFEDWEKDGQARTACFWIG